MMPLVTSVHRLLEIVHLNRSRKSEAYILHILEATFKKLVLEQHLYLVAARSEQHSGASLFLHLKVVPPSRLVRDEMVEATSKTFRFFC